MDRRTIDCGILEIDDQANRFSGIGLKVYLYTEDNFIQICRHETITLRQGKEREGKKTYGVVIEGREIGCG